MPLPDPRLEDQPDHHRDSRPGHAGEAIGQGAGRGTGESIHQTLAVRVARRNLLRAERAARLARLRPAEVAEIRPEIRPENPAGDRAAATEDAGAALEDFLRALTGGMALAAPLAVPGTASRPALEVEVGAIPRLPRRGAMEPAARADPAPESVFAPETTCDLDRLPGAGPGLIWALRRAGLRRLADLAPLEASDLAARLGPLGRLVPAAAWIAAARAAGRETAV